MADPSKWAKEAADTLVAAILVTGDFVKGSRNVALALDATRKEALRVAERTALNCGKAVTGGIAQRTLYRKACNDVADAIALIDKPPAPPADGYAQYQDGVSGRWVKISRRAGRIIARQLEPFEGVPIYEPPADD